ncbi:hypothetical protein EV421DRAFT_1743255 [Armillaria borealis]|uniref:Uncharacterized protein n=1 Tax=Armillaria borealis TaxID=47425 RepID=A0AA39MEW7_9AGAR|nr:hypothetical protein EV421DRAFT_1743255 [Armillaria borealis]
MSTGMGLLLPNGLLWSIHCETRRGRTELVTKCKWMFPAAWAHRRRTTVLGRRFRCGSRYKAVDSQGEIADREDFGGESTGCSYARIGRAKILVSPFSTRKNECGREFARQQPSTYSRVRRAGRQAARARRALSPLNMVMDSFGSGRQQGATTVTALL